MTSELSHFAQRLGELIHAWSRHGQTLDMGRDEGPQLQNGSGPALSEQAQAGVCPPAVDGSERPFVGDFNQLALELFALQYQHNAPLRQLCQRRGITPSSVRQWQDIPALPTAAFKEWEVTCLPPAIRTVVFESSGTTGGRLSRHFHHPDSLTLYETALWAGFKPHLLADYGSGRPRLQLAILTPSPRHAPHSSLVHMFDTIRRRLGEGEAVFLGRPARDGAWTLDFDTAPTVLARACTQARPLLILGTAFGVVQMLDCLRQRNLRFRLPAGSRLMETGGYKSRTRHLPKAELYGMVSRWLDLPPGCLVSEYGMCELSSQAYDWIAAKDIPAEAVPGVAGHRLAGIPPPTAAPGAGGAGEPSIHRVFRFPPWARVEVVSPETGQAVAEGQTGLIRVWDLANVFSVLAIQTEDLGLRRADGFEWVGRLAAAEPRGCSLMSAHGD